MGEVSCDFQYGGNISLEDYASCVDSKFTTDHVCMLFGEWEGVNVMSEICDR